MFALCSQCGVCVYLTNLLVAWYFLSIVKSPSHDIDKENLMEKVFKIKAKSISLFLFPFKYIYIKHVLKHACLLFECVCLYFCAFFSLIFFVFVFFFSFVPFILTIFS